MTPTAVGGVHTASLRTEYGLFIKVSAAAVGSAQVVSADSI